MSNKVRVVVNGYGVIGKRIADAVVVQDDMKLVGVADVVSDWHIKIAMKVATANLEKHKAVGVKSIP